MKISWLGFLGFLGAVPGWERMWGFTGFFGFIGVATFIEIFHRRRDGTRHPALRTWWHKAWVSLLLVVVIVIPVRMFLLQVFVLPGGEASPELPKGSRVLVWKLAGSLSMGDMIVYEQDGKAFAGRVAKAEGTEIIVRRNNTGDITVPRSNIIGKVILNTRASSVELRGPAAPKPPADAGPAPPMPTVPLPVPAPGR